MEAESTSVSKALDEEKSYSAPSPAVDDMPHKIELRELQELQELSPDDVDSSEKADEMAEKETEGSMRDYFVSKERE